MSSVSKPIQEYPVQGLMPKRDTEVASFLKKYPEYDGRGTVIAILDTGVDPGASGLKVTTDGKPKIIDIVDCTGGGDVVTTTIVKPKIEERDGQKVSTIQGLSGRTLILDPSWNCPSGEYRIGVKRAYELFPAELVNRLKADRRKAFEIEHAKLLSEAQKRLADFRKLHPTVTGEKLTAESADLEARVENLKELMKSYEDPGVILDCVVFHDGKDWRAVIDVNESGDLRGQPCLTDYRKELQYHTFGKADLLNFSVNIYQDGNLLSIVTLSGSHGTHVAGIAAANFPDEPELNGVAPGAQIISLRIGDARLGSMETGTGLTRAASHMAMHKVDLANMSYGESSSLPRDGHFIKLLAEEAISKSGCIFVTSAGNDGPCFSSIGAPAGMSASFITVGAFVKHSQMQAEYAMLESVSEQPFTWSSRGPCTDGYQGVDIYAPGSAITSVPVYGLNKLDLKNGTSMSSPNACGCIAVLVSALKANKLSYTPYRLKTAVVQTGKSVNDPLNVGFIQVEKAWEYLETYKDRKDLDILFEVSVAKRGNQRGIYLREYEESNQVQYVTVRINPTFVGEVDLENPRHNWDKFEYESRVALVASESWITAPDYLYLHSKGNTFQVKVDPRSLKESQFYYGEVLGFDTTSPERGPLFRVPVSVVKPTVPRNGSLEYRNIEFSPGQIMRRFIHVPDGATFAQLRLRSRAPENTSPARFMLHLLQLVPKKNQKNKQAYSFMLGSGSYGDPNADDQVITVRFAVRGGLNMEFALAQFWSGLGKHEVDMEIEFHGIQVGGNLNSQGVINLEPHVTRLEVMCPIRKEDNIEAKVSFNKLRKYLAPTEATISPLHPDRDTLPNSRLLYALTLTYVFSSEANSSIVPLFPSIMNQLYEHFLAGVFGIVYDSHKKVVGYFDVFEHTIKLERKGEYTIMLQLTTENEGTLEKLKGLICELDISVKNVNFNIHRYIADVYNAEKSTVSKLSLERRDTKVFYIAPPIGEQSWLPKEAKTGDALVGKVSFSTAKVDGGEYRALYHISPETKSSSNSSKDIKNSGQTAASNDEKINAQMADAIRDLQISYLEKFGEDSQAKQALLAKLEKDYADDVEWLQYKIGALWKAAGGTTTECLLKPGKLSKDKAEEISKLCDRILDLIDQRELHEFYGRHQGNGKDETDETIKEMRKEMDKKKQQVVNALKNKAMAWGSTVSNAGDNNDPEASSVFEQTYKALQQWCGSEEKDSTTDLQSMLLKVRYERVAGRHGNALKITQKFLDDINRKSDTVSDEKKAWSVRSELFRELGWSLWSKYDGKWSVIREPPTGYAPF